MSNPSLPCPWCGETIGDLNEYFDRSADEETEVECGSCGGDVTLSRVVRVTYTVERSL